MVSRTTQAAPHAYAVIERHRTLRRNKFQYVFNLLAPRSEDLSDVPMLNKRGRGDRKLEMHEYWDGTAGHDQWVCLRQLEATVPLAPDPVHESVSISASISQLLREERGYATGLPCVQIEGQMSGIKRPKLVLTPNEAVILRQCSGNNP